MNVVSVGFSDSTTPTGTDFTLTKTIFLMFLDTNKYLSRSTPLHVSVKVHGKGTMMELTEYIFFHFENFVKLIWISEGHHNNLR